MQVSKSDIVTSQENSRFNPWSHDQLGNDRVTELTLEVESRQVIKKRMGQRIRKEMWDDMEVKGKAIKVRTLLLSTKLNFATYATLL